MPDQTELEAQQAAGQPGEGADDTAPARPDFLVENFTTVEDQARGYAEARREMQRAQEDRARYEQMLGEMAQELTARESAPAEPMGEDPLVARMQQALDEGDAQAVLALNVYAAQQVVEKSVKDAQAAQWGPDQTGMFAAMVEQTAMQAYGDPEEFVALKEEWGPLLRQRPYLLPDTRDVREAAEALLFVVNSVKARKGTAGATPPGNPEVGEIFGTLTGEAGIDDHQAKRLAQSLHGAGVRQAAPQADDNSSYWERVVNSETGNWRG